MATPKGRRNVGESRQAAAVRETCEETGYKCYLLRVILITRAPLADSTNPVDRPRACSDVCEPFMLSFQVREGGDPKLIWWCIAGIDEVLLPGSGEPELCTQLFSFDEALQTLTFDTDSEVVRTAIEIFVATFDEYDDSEEEA